MVPKGWKVVSGDEISIKITKGQSPRWQGFEYQDSGTLFVTSENVRDGSLDISNPKFLPLTFNEKLKGSQLVKGDILINIVGASIGRSCLFDIDVAAANINQAVCLLRVNQGVALNIYIHQYLQSSISINRLLGTQTESARPNLSLGDIRDFEFLLPPLPEQRKIAQILSTWDKVIATTERLLANKQQQKKALMQRLLTGKQRFAGFEGEWQDLTLTEVAQITMGSSPLSTAYNETGDGLPLIQGNADIKDRLSAPRIHTSQITKECIADDVLLSVRAPVGTVAKSRHHACIGRGIAAIRAKGLLSQEYLYQLLLDFEPKWERLSQGSTFESVNSDDIKSMPVRLPCIKEQQKIASVLLATDTEITTIQSQLDNLKLQKKALMQQLLTGKRRVKVDEAAA